MYKLTLKSINIKVDGFLQKLIKMVDHVPVGLGHLLSSFPRVMDSISIGQWKTESFSIPPYGRCKEKNHKDNLHPWRLALKWEVIGEQQITEVLRWFSMTAEKKPRGCLSKRSKQLDLPILQNLSFNFVSYMIRIPSHLDEISMWVKFILKTNWKKC